MEYRLVNDANLEALIESKNFKQALKNVEKKLKKDTKNANLLVRSPVFFLTSDNANRLGQITKACILYDYGEIDESLRLCKDVTRRKPPVHEIDQVASIYQLSALLSRDPNVLFDLKVIEQLWQNTINVQKNTSARLSVVQEWADQSISISMWAFFAKVMGSHHTNRG